MCVGTGGIDEVVGKRGLWISIGRSFSRLYFVLIVRSLVRVMLFLVFVFLR